MIKNDFKPIHIIHQLLYAPIDKNGPVAISIIGRTRLMKMIFIFEKEILKSFFRGEIVDFGFSAYNYGPFSAKVYEALDFLVARDYVEIKTSRTILTYEDQNDADLDWKISSDEEKSVSLLDSSNQIDYINEEFCLTDKGIQLMKNKEKWFSFDNLNDDQKQTIIKFKNNMVNTKLRDILKYVYKKYPAYAKKSLIYNELMEYGIADNR